jgi:hypothetical protein
MATSRKSSKKSSKKSGRKSSPAKSKAKSAGRKAAKGSKAGKTSAKSKSAKKAVKAKPRRRAAKRQPEESAGAPNAVRLTFSYAGDEVKLVSQQAVQMVVPPSDPVKSYKKEKGFWAELKGDQDKTLYRQVMHNPTRNDAEVFSDDPNQSISRAPAPQRKGVFVVVVPQVAEAAHVALSRSPDPRPTKAGAMQARSLAAAPATEIARFKLKK